MQLERGTEMMSNDKPFKTTTESNQETVKRSWNGFSNLDQGKLQEQTQTNQDNHGNQQEPQDSQNSEQNSNASSKE